MGRRQGPSEERRAAILAAAEAVFSEAGYAGASIRQIATRAGVSSALLYWFFPNKAQLFAAVLIGRIDAQHIFEFPPATLDLPPEVLLPRLADGYLRLMNSGEQVRLMKLVLRESTREPELVATLAEALMNRVLEPVRVYLAHQMALGRLRPADPAHLAHVLFGPLISLLLRRELLQEPSSRDWDLGAFGDLAVDVFLRGALAPAGTTPAPQPGVAPAAAVPAPPIAPRRVVIEE